jgi:hypothetical protein
MAHRRGSRDDGCMTDNTPTTSGPLENVAVEVERHVSASGWDQPPQIFALVDTAELLRAQPDLADAVGVTAETVADDSLTPVEQDPLPDAPLDETLGRIAWPEAVRGCALVHEIVVLPPEAEDAMPEDADAAEYAARHPDRREARLAVAVLRDGTRASVVRLRGTDGEEDALLTAPDVAPNLADALLATLR